MNTDIIWGILCKFAIPLSTRTLCVKTNIPVTYSLKQFKYINLYCESGEIKQLTEIHIHHAIYGYYNYWVIYFIHTHTHV